MNWFLLAMKNTFDFKGRARRKELGWFALISSVILLMLFLIFEFTISLSLNSSTLRLFFAILYFGFIFGIVCGLLLAISISSMSLVVRRLHDLGYSGWWYLAMYIFSLLVLLISVKIGENFIILGGGGDCIIYSNYFLSRFILKRWSKVSQQIWR